MTGNWRCKLALVFLSLLAFTTPALWGGTVYVKQDSPNDGPGSDWDHAYHTVTAGLNAAVSGDEVWVAKGTYVERITLNSGVAFYGGFAGTETLRDQRNWKTSVTILDGNEEGTVVTVPGGATASIRIDGFSIRNGGDWGYGVECNSPCAIENNEFTFNRYFGVRCFGCSATIKSNTFYKNQGCVDCWSASSPEVVDNVLTDNYAGIYCTDSSPTIARNTITGCRAPALWIGGSSSPLVTGNTITRNTRLSWAAVECYGGSPIIAGNVITQNTSFSDGGAGIYCRSGSPIIVNNIIAGNTARGAYSEGGGICCYRSGATIINNTIVGNTAEYAGGLSCGRYTSSSISNNIVAFNSSGVYCSILILRNNNLYANTAYNYYPGLSPGVGDISLDPLFANRLGGDYHLGAGSPCIDKGWNDAAGMPEFDMDGQTRVHGAAVDIGADEWWASIADAKKATQGSIELSGEVVTAAFPDFFYVESLNRVSGMRVEQADHGMSAGVRANVTGPVGTGSNGERCIAADTVSQIGSGTVLPLSTKNASLGGGTFGLQQGIWGWHTKKIDGAWMPVWSQACGLNNIGLLARVCGKVTLAGRGWFYIDDGSRVSDGSGILGIYVNAPSLAVPPKDAMVAVTGISSCDLYLGYLVNTFLPRDHSDIEVIASPVTALAAAEPSDAPDPRARPR